MRAYWLALCGALGTTVGCERTDGGDGSPPDAGESILDARSDGHLDVGDDALADGSLDAPSESLVEVSRDALADSSTHEVTEAETRNDGEGSRDGAESETDQEDGAATESGRPVCTACSSYAEPSARAEFPPELGELSGLAASAVHPGILYAHNDSGDLARFFALTDTGTVTGEFLLDGVVAVDWEDMARGPCSNGSCLYLGDIGDNDARRASYAIYRTTEPAELPASPDRVTVPYEHFVFVYPDGAHNAETLLVHPGSGRIFVVVKGVVPDVYEVPTPLVSDEVATLTKVATLTLPLLAGVVTGGSFHPCGDRMLIRTYAALYEYILPPNQALESIFSAPPTQVPVAVEAQGEAVTYTADGRGYFTGSETVSAAEPPSLNATICP